MDVQSAVDLSREAIRVCLMISAPLLATGLSVAIVIGLLQSVTQVQESSVAFIPKVVLMLLVLSFTLPWIGTQLVEYCRELFLGIPERL